MVITLPSGGGRDHDPDLIFCWSVIFSENRFPPFRIMLDKPARDQFAPVNQSLAVTSKEMCPHPAGKSSQGSAGRDACHWRGAELLLRSSQNVLGDRRMRLVFQLIT